MIIVLILILLFILLERKYGTFFEKFIDTDYDYYYNGDVLIDTRNKDVSVGIGNNDPRYTLNGEHFCAINYARKHIDRRKDVENVK